MKDLLLLLGGAAAIIAAAGWGSVVFDRFDPAASALTAQLGLQASAVLLAAWGVVRQLEENRSQSIREHRLDRQSEAYFNLLEVGDEFRLAIVGAASALKREAENLAGRDADWVPMGELVGHHRTTIDARASFQRSMAAALPYDDGFVRVSSWWEPFDQLEDSRGRLLARLATFHPGDAVPFRPTGALLADLIEEIRSQHALAEECMGRLFAYQVKNAKRIQRAMGGYVSEFDGEQPRALPFDPPAPPVWTQTRVDHTGSESP